MAQPTMDEIAREIGVSRRTVSSVINGKASERRISKKTVRRVKACLVERGYVPSWQALSLRNGSRHRVGILYCSPLYSHLIDAFNQMVDAIVDSPRCLQLIVVPRDRLVEGMTELVARGVADLVWLHALEPQQELLEDRRLLPLLGNVNTVIYNYRFGSGKWDNELVDRGIHLVGVERLKGFARLACFLKGLGHRRIALPDIHTGHLTADAKDRLSVFDRRGLVAIPSLPRSCSLKTATAWGARQAAGILRAMAKSSVTAACFYDDEVAGHAIALLRRRGVSVPNDLTVTGFDGLAITQAFSPRLTTLRVPTDVMVARVLELIARPSGEYVHRFDLRLIKGESHARCRSGGNT